MFKKLKQKIEEGVANSPVRAQVQQKDTEEDGGGDNISHSEPINSINSPRMDGPAQLSVSQTGINMLGTPTANHGTPNVYSTPPEHLPSISAFSISDDVLSTPVRSRTSSVSSNTSEAGLFSPMQFATRQYVLPSDVESEVEDSSGVALGSVTKDTLYQHFRQMQRRSEKYKAKFAQVMNAYKEIERERDKLKTNMTTCQDRAFRRISELKEQIQLDVLAKQDLEANYSLMLEEKAELIKVLHTQISLLKEGKDLPEELIKKSVVTEQNSTPEPPASPDSASDEASINTAALKEKIQRLEVLLNKCKETIKNNKERMAQVNNDRDIVQRQLEERDTEVSRLKDGFQKEQSKLQAQISEARHLMEDLETDKVMQVAEAKQQMHVSMETKDRELESIRASCTALQSEKERLETKVARLEKTATEQLEKSREVIRRLTEDKKKVSDEVKQSLKTSEDALEAEREALMTELKRGKAAALTLMQEEMERKMADLCAEQDTALQQRDTEWQLKMEAKDKDLEASITEYREELARQLAAKEEELGVRLRQTEEAMKRSLSERHEAMVQRLAEREEEMKLEIEERELQKMAALSQQDNAKDELARVLEEVRAENINLENSIENLREDHKAQVKDFMNQIEVNAKRNKDKFELLTVSHEKQLDQLRAENQESLSIKMEEFQQQHQLHIDNMSQSFEARLNELNSDNTTFLTSQIDVLKSDHQKAVEETQEQLESYRKQASELSQAKVELQTEIAEMVQRYEARVAELEQKLKDQTELTERLTNDKEKLDQEKVRFEEKTKEMLAQIASRNAHLEQLTTEKSNLTQNFEQQRKCISEKNDALHAKDQHMADITQQGEDEKARLNSEVEMRKKELLQKVEQYETQLKEERSNHERELAQRLELEQLQQRSSADEICTELNKLLSSANEKIAAQELLVHELRMKESDLGNQLASSQQESSSKIVVLTQAKDNLMKKVEDLVEKEKQLKENKQQLESEYEAKCASQTVSIAELTKNVKLLTTAEHDLQERLTAALQDCDSRLSTANDKHAVEVSHLSQTISQNQSQFESVIQELEVARGDISHISKKSETEAQQKLVELSAAQDKIQEGRAELEKIRSELESQIAEVQQRSDELKQVHEELHEKASLVDSSNQRVAELEQNLSTWKVAAEEKEGAEGNLLHKIAEMETTSQQQREALQEKVVFLEKEILQTQQAGVEGKEAAVLEMQGHLDKKNAELEMANRKFGQLREEAKGRIKDLKSQMEETTLQLDDKDKQIEAKETEMKMRVQTMLEEFEQEKADLDADKQGCVKTLTEKLEEERKSVTTLQEDVRKREHENEERVKEMKSALNDKFKQELKEKEDTLNQHAEKTEMAAEREKMHALAEAQSTFDKQFEEFKVKNNENHESTKSVLEDKYMVELESMTVKLFSTQSAFEELTIEKETVSRDIDRLKADDEQKITELSAVLHELQSQNESLAEAAEHIRKRNTELMTEHEKYELELQEKISKEELLEKQTQDAVNKSLSLEEAVKKLSEQIELSQAGSNSLQEECQSRIQSIQQQYQYQVQNKQAELEESINNIKINYEEEIEKMKMEHNNTLEQQVAMLEENNIKLKEHAALVERKQEEIKELREKFRQLRDKAGAKVEEMRIQLDAKDQKAIAAAEQSHATRVEYEARLAEMTENDSELQTKLKELTSKLNNTEEQLQEYTHTYESTMQGSKKELKTQKLHYEEQIALLTQQVTEFRDQSRMTTEGLQKELQSKVDEKNTQLKELVDKHSQEVAKLKEDAQRELQELKQQYTIKVKDVMQEADDKVKQLETALQEAINAKENAMQEINSLKEVTNSKQSHISEIETKFKVTEIELNDKFDAQEAELKILRDELEIEKRVRGQTKDKLQEQLSVQHEKLQAEYESQLQAQTTDVTNRLSALEEQKQQELQALVEDFNQQMKDKHKDLEEQQDDKLKELEDEMFEKLKAKDDECQAKLVELKKKAETRFLQIKKTLVGNQESAVAEFSKSNTRLQDVVSGLETKLSQIEQEKVELETRLSEQERENLEVMDRLRATFDEEIKTKQSVIEESLQKSESKQELEVKLKFLATNLKKEKEQLNERITALETEIADLQTEKGHLEKDKSNLQSRIDKNDTDTKKQKQEMEWLKNSHDVDIRTMKLEHEEEMEKMKAEFEGRIEDIENDHNVRIKQLVKEFQLKIAEKDRDFQNTFSNVVEKSQREEDKTAFEHRQEMEELLQDLHEKDQKMEELIDDHEVQIQASEEMTKAAIAEKDQLVSNVEEEMARLRQEVQQEREAMEADVRAQLTKQFEGRMRQHHEEVDGLTKEWQLERQRSTASASDESQPQELVQQNQLTLNAIQSSSSSSELLRHHVIALTKQLEELKVRHKLELMEVRSGRDMQKRGLSKPLLAGSDTAGPTAGLTEDLMEGSEVQQLELQNMDLQTHLLQQSAEVAKLKVTERDLKHQVDSLQKKVYALERGEVPPGSPYNNSTGPPAGPLLTEPTEMEYLRNILYEYMMGRETKTLARVIATVLRFSEEQTQRIINQEDARNAMM